MTGGSSRAYPDAPRIAVLSIARDGDRVLLVRRAKSPEAGHWGFPGGEVELGESVFDAARRELLEETGIRAEPAEILTAVDYVDRDGSGGIRFHYVMLAVLMRAAPGEPVAADDAAEARWFSPGDLDGHPLCFGVGDVLDLARARRAPPGCGGGPMGLDDSSESD